MRTLLATVSHSSYSVPYAALVKAFEKCEQTTKRLEITEHLVMLFIQVIRLKPEELRETLYLCINKVRPTQVGDKLSIDIRPQLCPDYEGLELGIGESFMMKAIAQSTGRNIKAIKASYQEIGDLGTVARVSTYLLPIQAFNKTSRKARNHKAPCLLRLR